MPEGWVKIRLGSVAELQRGFDLPSSQRLDGCVPIVSSGGITGYHNEAKSKAPGVVTGRYGSIGDVFYLEEDFWPLNTSLWVKDFHGNHEKFIYYLLSNFDFKKFSDKTGVPGVNRNDLHVVKVGLPPLPEQKKIAQILSTWDKAIITTEQLLANSQQQKQALMQQLLTGKKRLLDENGERFQGEWEETAIADFIKESRVPGSTGDIAKKITVKLYGNGVIAKDEKRSGSESTKYYRRSAGQFIYSKLDFLNGAFGIVPEELDGYESTLDLPAFDFLGTVNIEWFTYFVSREEFYSSNLGLANGGRKARRVNPNDLLKIQIPTPPIKEQQKIAAVLSAADKEITTLQQQLERLKQEKKALMQQLLTGKRRVKLDEGETDE